MPDTPPTVIESDRILARKWYRCGCGATYETIMESEPADGDHHHVADEVDRMAAEIAAAREAWGVSREAVAALVEAAERAAVYLTSGVTGGIDEPPVHVALLATLERVKPKVLWAHEVDDLNRPMETMRELP